MNRRNKKRIFLALVLNALTKRSRPSRRFYVVPEHVGRKTSIFKTFLSYKKAARNGDGILFERFIHMNLRSYEKLLSLTEEKLKHCQTHSFPISAQERLVMTLRCFAHGISFSALSAEFLCGKNTVSEIVAETSKVICEILPSYVMPPLSRDIWLRSEEQFRLRWNFPNCMGAMDGKHIRIRVCEDLMQDSIGKIQCLPHSGSLNYNYKHYFSISLLAVVDGDYKFMYVNVGEPGSCSDAGIWNRCALKKAVESGRAHIPLQRLALPGTGVMTNFVLVADEGFGGSEFVMRPYPRAKTLTVEQRIFNYRLGRARRIVENAFGILASKWRIFYWPLHADEDTIGKVVMACILLHNLCRESDVEIVKLEDLYIDKSTVDEEDVTVGIIRPGTWREHNYAQCGFCDSHGGTRSVQSTRDIFAKYFNSPIGAVDWQQRYLDKGLI